MLILGKAKSATAVTFASVLGTGVGKRFRQFTLYADPDNAGSCYFGGSNVTGVPANEKLKLKAGLSMNLGPESGARPFTVDLDSLYFVGSDANQICYFIVETDDGTS